MIFRLLKGLILNCIFMSRFQGSTICSLSVMQRPDELQTLKPSRENITWQFLEKAGRRNLEQDRRFSTKTWERPSINPALCLISFIQIFFQTESRFPPLVGHSSFRSSARTYSATFCERSTWIGSRTLKKHSGLSNTTWIIRPREKKLPDRVWTM